MTLMVAAQALYFLSTLAAFSMIIYKRTPLRFLLVSGYTIFSVLYIFDIYYHASVGFIGWSAINFVLFYEIVVADRKNK